VTNATSTVSLNGGLNWTQVLDATQTPPTLTTSSPTGRTVTASLDGFDRVTSVAVPGLTTVQRFFDPQGRLDHVTAGARITAGARTVQFQYDAASGYLASVTDPIGQVTSITSRDLAGRLKTLRLPDTTSTIQAGYDLNGNTTSVTVPAGYFHGFTPTRNDLLQAYTPPAVAGTGSTAYAYDNDPQLTSVTRPDGLLSFGFDSFGRSQTTTQPAAQVSTTYVPGTDLVASITTSDGTAFNLGYDGSILTSTTWTAGLPTSSAHSVLRTIQPSARTFKLGIDTPDQITWAFDQDGLLSNAGQLSISRDPLGQRNGLIAGTTLLGVTDSFSYNGFAEPMTYSASFGGQALYSVTYTRDGLGRIDSRTETIRRTGSGTDSPAPTFYKYDALGRLFRLCADSNCNTILQQYNYDADGNRLGGTYDAQDRMTAFGATTYAYTANGDLQTKTVGGQTTTYSYDLLGGLRSVQLPGQPLITYVIDGAGRRIGKRVGGVYSQAFLYQDGLGPIAELDPTSNTVLRLFVYGTRSNVPDYISYPGAGAYRVITDQLGSPRLVVNASSGAVVHRIDYDAFGAVTNESLAADGVYTAALPFGFAGGLYDRDTALLRFGARDYDPAIGRWLSKDPAGLSGGLNLFQYAAGDPVNFVDINGRWIVPAVFVVVTIATIVIQMGAAAPSDTSKAPANVFAMAAAVLPLKGLPVASRTTTLWRAVGPDELADIKATGTLRTAAGGEGKYFSMTPEGASSYARQACKGFGDPPYTIIQTQVPNGVLQQALSKGAGVVVDRGIPTVVLPAETLPSLSAPQILPFSPL
jgi:RHS repeat-associated protein